MGADELRAALQSDEPLSDEETLWTDVLETGDPPSARSPHRVPSRHARDPRRLGVPTGIPKLVGTSEALARLIDAGFDINRRDWQGGTLLHYCAEFDNAEIAGDLLRRGAATDTVELIHGGTPLATAARSGAVNVVELLLAEGADPVAPVEHPWARPLAQARRAGHDAIADLLTGRTGT